MKNQKMLLLVCLLLLALEANASDMKQEENITTNKIEVEDYHEIRINGLMEFYYEQSEEQSAIEVTLNQELHSKLKVEVKNRILTIELKGVKEEQITKFLVKASSKWLKAIRVGGNANTIISKPFSGDELEVRANANSLVQLKGTINVEDLKLKISGSGNIIADDLHTKKLDCNLEGSGSITIKQGKADKGEYSIAGGSDLHAYGMAVADLDCKMTGNALAEIFATNNLNASIVGKGEIRHKGEAVIRQKIYGKGVIKHIE